MIRHTVFWKFSPDVIDPEEQVEAMRLRFRALKSSCPGFLDVFVEPTLPGSTHDLVISCLFTDQEALDAYQFHPGRLALRAESTRFLTDRACADWISDL